MWVRGITAASFHGTGTVANDVNEAELTQLQMAHLGRAAGLPLLHPDAVWQPAPALSYLARFVLTIFTVAAIAVERASPQ